MSIHAAEFNLFSIDVNNRTFYMNFTNSDAVCNDFVFCHQNQRIQMRIFRIPQHRMLDMYAHLMRIVSILLFFRVCRANQRTVFIVQFRMGRYSVF